MHSFSSASNTLPQMFGGLGVADASNGASEHHDLLGQMPESRRGSFAHEHEKHERCSSPSEVSDMFLYIAPHPRP